ncbi:hypothetical protein BRADI_4g27465v3 [Brachypodium distachyon]|uniref:DUF1618 domain-containing protein n=1 Tax=Brachypodium distachyon TaxID=15368 RepID=A0A0Q3PK24_BRADI|nr:hypothetical protein BRADI_4g27465v3 [Brachypodium distachyon]
MGDAAVPNRGQLPSILLSRRPRFTDSGNNTTATAESKDGYTMGVSFSMAEPPQLSLLSIHCTDPRDMENTARSNFSSLPHVVGADGPFILLRDVFQGGGFHEYFLYKAGVAPSLRSSGFILLSSWGDAMASHNLSKVRELGILGHGGDHYLLAALHNSASSDGYELRIYSSETKSWSTRTLHNPCPGVDRVIPDKVITLGQGGLLGWVDLLHGVLVCDLLLLLQDQDPPVVGAVSFIPLPRNRYKLKYPIIPEKVEEHPLARDFCSANWFRDLTCVNGVLEFVEMENPPPENKDNIIYDSDLIMSLKRKAVDRNSMDQLSSLRDAWRAVTWKLTFRDLYSAFPILSPDDGNDILYLKSIVEPNHQDGWVAAVDIGNKALKAIGRYYLPDDFYYSRGYDPEHPLCASTLSRHLDLTSGNQVSACRKKTEAKRPANHRIVTSTPQPWFNNCNWASYHGYSHQLSAPNSFAYGAHAGYGNYQQQWPQPPPTLDLPIGASWQHPPPPGSSAASANTS